MNADLSGKRIVITGASEVHRMVMARSQVQEGDRY